MKQTIILIEKIIALNKLYEDGIKKVAKENDVDFGVMRRVMDGVIKNPRLEIAAIKFLEEYELAMAKLAKEIGVDYIGTEQTAAFREYAENLLPKELIRLQEKEKNEIILFLDILFQMNISSKFLSEEQRDFYDRFHYSIIK